MQTRTARAARPRSGPWAAADVEATTGGQPTTRWAPSPRKNDAPAMARRDTSRKCARRQRRRGRPSSETTASRGSSSRPCRTTTKGIETETPSLRNEGRDTATTTVTADTEDTAGRRHTLQESDPGAAHAVRAETGAATRVQTGAGTRARAAARNAAGAAAPRRAETRRSLGDETEGATKAGATAETAGPRVGTIKRGEGTSPIGFPPLMRSNGKGLRRRPTTGNG